jgi:hypothetical protein
VENAKGLKCGSGSQRARRWAGSHHEDAERILSTSPAEICASPHWFVGVVGELWLLAVWPLQSQSHWPGSGRVAKSANANSRQVFPYRPQLAIGSIGLSSSGLWGLVFHLFAAETGVDTRVDFH